MISYQLTYRLTHFPSCVTITLTRLCLFTRSPTKHREREVHARLFNWGSNVFFQWNVLLIFCVLRRALEHTPWWLCEIFVSHSFSFYLFFSNTIIRWDPIFISLSLLHHRPLFDSYVCAWQARAQKKEFKCEVSTPTTRDEVEFWGPTRAVVWSSSFGIFSFFCCCLLIT
jgi:hypothetical protein